MGMMQVAERYRHKPIAVTKRGRDDAGIQEAKPRNVFFRVELINAEFRRSRLVNCALFVREWWRNKPRKMLQAT